MAILSRKIAAFLKKIADLPDRPGGTMATAELKAQFDSSPEELRVAHNGLVDDLASVTPGSSGAEQIGSAPITGLAGDTPYEQIADLKSQLNQATTAQILPASITEDKLAFPVVRKDGGTMTGNLSAPLVIGTGGTIQAGTTVGLYSQLRYDGALARGNAGALGSFNNIWDDGRLRTINGYPEWNNGGTWQGVGGVKGVQKGKTVVNASTSAAVTVDVTISPVNVAKSVIVLPWAYNQQSSTNHTSNFDAELVNATTLRFTAGVSAASTVVTIAWQVVEYY